MTHNFQPAKQTILHINIVLSSCTFFYPKNGDRVRKDKLLRKKQNQSNKEVSMEKKTTV